jgi:hypothetical protein
VETDYQFVERVLAKGYIDVDDSLELARRSGRLRDPLRFIADNLEIIARAALGGDAEAARAYLRLYPASAAESPLRQRLRVIVARGSN